MGHLSQFGVVNEVGSVSVDEGTQGQAILPTEKKKKRKEGGMSEETAAGKEA